MDVWIFSSGSYVDMDLVNGTRILVLQLLAEVTSMY
jgi:hypothetical protein